ncbi:MAG: hypothetical protein M1839_009423 [Geoglossum umbratile]|nr:MAG: hypothetical protein M1839_009423 [Geoglossum umbratile]
MASDNRRNTIFPGSDPLTAQPHPNKESRSLRDDKTSIGYTASRRKKIPAIRLPINPSNSSTELLPVLSGSPWDLYKKDFSIELGGSIAVVHKKPVTEDLFAIRSFSGQDTDEKLYMLCLLRHESFLLSHEIFFFEDTYFIVSEYMAISLEELTIARPDELQLAIIIHQILNGISFLVKQGLTHGSITCSNILVSTRGVVKIAIPECCCRKSSLMDIVALGCVMKQLMEGPTEAKISGLKNPGYWSEEAVDFYSLTLSASPEQLAQLAQIPTNFATKGRTSTIGFFGTDFCMQVLQDMR